MAETDVALAAALIAGPVDPARLQKLFRHVDQSRLPGILLVMPDRHRLAWEALLKTTGHVPSADATGTP